MASMKRRYCFLFGIVVCLAVATADENTTDGGGEERSPFFGKPKKWMNWHKTIIVGGDYEKLLTPQNNVVLPKGTFTQTQDFLTGLSQLQSIVDQAVTDGKRLRAFGSKWSSSGVAYDDEYVMESGGLNFVKIGFDNDTHVTAAYQPKKDKLAFVQAGVMIQYLHKALYEKGLALSTTGAADGQRLAGCVSTGTHGSNNQFGSVQEFVRGIHLVIPGEHVFIQKASDPVITTEFTTWLDGARLIEDDDMFYAALISIGSFGIVHGYVIEVEPLYKLKMHSKQVGFAEFGDVLKTLDVGRLGFEGVNELPMHFEMTINPYKRKSKCKGAFVRVFQKIPLTAQELIDLQDSRAAFRTSPAEFDLSEAMAHAKFNTINLKPLTNILKRRIYAIGLSVPLVSFFDTRGRQPQTKFPFEFFTSKNACNNVTGAPLPGIGLEFGVPQEKILDFLNVVFDVLWHDPAPMPVAVRFVKSSQATLAFTKFENLTATIEFPAPYDRIVFKRTRIIQNKMFDAMWAKRFEIPHTYHWGQGQPVNGYWVAGSYGEDLVKWKEQRYKLLDEAGREVFSSKLMVTLGIHP